MDNQQKKIKLTYQWSILYTILLYVIIPIVMIGLMAQLVKKPLKQSGFNGFKSGQKLTMSNMVGCAVGFLGSWLLATLLFTALLFL